MRYGKLVVLFSSIILSFACRTTSADRPDTRDGPRLNPVEDGLFLDVTKFDEKTIFTYWDKGRDHLMKNRPFEAKVIQEWEASHGKRGWNVVVVDSVPGSDYNIETLIEQYNKLPETIKNKTGFKMPSLDVIEKKGMGVKNRPAQAYSDVVRLALLDAFGGTWMDSSIILGDSLENIAHSQLYDQSHKSMMGFTLPMQGLSENRYNDSLESWFLMAKKGSAPIRAWRKNIWEFIEAIPDGTPYGKLKVLDHPMFKGNEALERSVKAISPHMREYLWVYNLWKKTLLDNPEFQSEMIIRNSDSIGFGPLGQEHVFMAEADGKKGKEAFDGKYLDGILERFRSNPLTTMVKYPSVNSTAIRETYKRIDDYEETRNLFTQLREIADDRSKLPPKYVEDDEAFHDFTKKMERIIRGDTKWWAAHGTAFGGFMRGFFLWRHRNDVVSKLSESIKKASGHDIRHLSKEAGIAEENLAFRSNQLEQIITNIATNQDLDEQNKKLLTGVLKKFKAEFDSDINFVKSHNLSSDIGRQRFLQELESIRLAAVAQQASQQKVFRIRNAFGWVMGTAIGGGATLGGTVIYNKWRQRESSNSEKALEEHLESGDENDTAEENGDI